MSSFSCRQAWGSLPGDLGSVDLEGGPGRQRPDLGCSHFFQLLLWGLFPIRLDCSGAKAVQSP